MNNPNLKIEVRIIDDGKLSVPAVEVCKVGHVALSPKRLAVLSEILKMDDGKVDRLMDLMMPLPLGGPMPATFGQLQSSSAPYADAVQRGVPVENGQIGSSGAAECSTNLSLREESMAPFQSQGGVPSKQWSRTDEIEATQAEMNRRKSIDFQNLIRDPECAGFNAVGDPVDADGNVIPLRESPAA